MPDLPKVSKWIPEKNRIIIAADLRGLIIHDLGLFNRRFRFLFTNGRFAEFVGDRGTKSGVNIYRPLIDWRREVKDSWKLKYMSPSELLQIRWAAEKYLEISRGKTTDGEAYNWLKNRSDLPLHVISALNHYIFGVKDLSQLLKLPTR